MKRTDSANYR